jgi:predicted TIM-barrel fold metal-dependent hydrolase
MMIDTHLHPLADDLQRYPMKPIGEQSAWSKGGFHLTADEILEHMASAGVDQATLVQASTAHGYDNSFCADSCARYPDRFVGVCCIDPLAPNAADTLSSWVEDRGMRGVRLFCISGISIGDRPSAPEPRWLDDPLTYSTWQRAEQLGIPVDVQVAMSGLDMVRNLLERFPRVNVILGHLAGPSLAEGPPYERAKDLLALARYPNLFLKFTTNNTRAASQGQADPASFFKLLLQTFGANRLLWGSNFPATQGRPGAAYREIVEEVQRVLSFLAPEDREWMFAGTARRLFPALATGAMG